MVRPLTEQDVPVLKDFAVQKPEANTFLIGNMEHFDMSADFLAFWGDFEYGKLVGVLMRYYRNFYISYLDALPDLESFTAIIKHYPGGPQSISSDNAVIDAVAPCFIGGKIERATLCRLEKQATFFAETQSNIRSAVPEDAERIFALIQTIDEFGTFSTQLIRNTLESRSGRIYYAENDIGDIISVAQTAAENSVSAMIIGVCTDKRYRRQGLMRQVMTRLCADMQKTGKVICLFFSNPNAGKMYIELGFRPVGSWTMMKF